MRPIYLSPPDVNDDDRAALLAAFDSGWIAPVGPEISGFEQDMAARVGVRHALALTSGTAALHLALVVLGIGRSDDVLVSDLTFVATANVVRYVGATPVFIDCDERNWCMDPTLLAEELDERARTGRPVGAVIAVDLYGQVADFDAISAICEQHNVPLVEDAAEALGATYQSKAAGSFGTLSVLSFNGNKTITTSGGGMLLSSREDQIDTARYLASQAREPVAHYEHCQIGYNYRLSNLLAALGRSQLRRLDEMVDRRRTINQLYRKVLSEVPGVSFMPSPNTGRSSCWLTCVTIDPSTFGSSRDDIIALLGKYEIEARPTWKPMHLQPVHAGAYCRGGSVGAGIFERGLCLPSGSALRDEDVAEICDLVVSCTR